VDSFAQGINKIISPINHFLSTWTNKSTTIEYVRAEDLISGLSSFFADFAEKLQNSDAGSTGLLQITNVLSNAFSAIADTVFAIFISLYFLVSKEKRYAQIMRMRNAIFSDKINGRISRIVSVMDTSFGGFVKGKFLDSIIVWVLCYIAFSIFRIPFALLISSFIAITNIIPVIGPLIGAIPTGIIILLTEPQKFIPFLIIVIILQQLEGNVISPKILGDNTGISSLCVVIAVSTMGSLWGFTGMILGVPLFASILKLGDYYTEKALQKKGLPAEAESYYSSDALVDPTKDAHLTTDKWVKRLEKNVLRIRGELRTKKAEELSSKDRFRMRIYNFAKKHRILSEIEDETFIQFGAEQQKKRILENTNARITEKDKQTEQNPS
jgi:predicted PurR-regulated permease PerM